jgi:hypothetical protein
VRRLVNRCPREQPGGSSARPGQHGRPPLIFAVLRDLFFIPSFLGWTLESSLTTVRDGAHRRRCPRQRRRPAGSSHACMVPWNLLHSPDPSAKSAMPPLYFFIASVALYPPPVSSCVLSVVRLRPRRLFLIITGGSAVDRWIEIQRLHVAQRGAWFLAAQNGPAQRGSGISVWPRPFAFFSEYLFLFLNMTGRFKNP